jgi:hypothetical protein
MAGKASKTLHSRRAILGLALTAVGVLVPLTFTLWYFHIHWTLVDELVVPVSGHVEVEFTPNFKGRYVSGIRVQRTLAFENLQCLLGEKNYIPESQCKDQPSVLQFKWQLKSMGHLVQAGTSDKQLSGAYAEDFVEMEFLYFESERGQHYTLELDFTEDGSKLDVTNPRLRVAVEPWDSFDMTMGFLWVTPFFVLFVAGLVLFIRATNPVPARANA